MDKRWIPLPLFSFLSALSLPNAGFACGGLTATIAEDPKPFSVKTESGPEGISLHFGRDGKVYVASKDIKISSALAEAIAKRYLEKKYKRYGHLEFEAFTYDHGDLVYMYHADVPNLAYSVHIGPVKSVMEHAHVHVSTLTGDVYGPGCGLGSGVVDMKFDPTEYPKDLNQKRLPYLQFNTQFVVKEGKAPKIDGRIDKAEWQGAAHQIIYVGTTKGKVTEYGWGGPGQAVAYQPERFKVEIYAKIQKDTIYFAVRADTTRWLALLLKDFEHHGMIGDFNDVKLLSAKGIEDYFLAGSPNQKKPGPRKLAGVHTWMASGTLVRDKDSNLKATGLRKLGQSMEYEFAFSYKNEDLGDSLWQMGKAYQIAILVGPSEEFNGVTEETWISDQVYVRLGSPSAESIYYPPYLVQDGKPDNQRHSHGATDEQKRTKEGQSQRKKP